MGRNSFDARAYRIGGFDWDEEKSAELAEYAKMDPSFNQQINSYLAKLTGQAANSPLFGFRNGGKDLVSMAQDMYLAKMRGNGGLRNYKGR